MLTVVVPIYVNSGIRSICPQAGAEQPLELRVAPEHAKRSIDGLAGHVVTYPILGSYVRHVRPKHRFPLVDRLLVENFLEEISRRKMFFREM